MKIILNKKERETMKKDGYVVRDFRYGELYIYSNGDTVIVKNHIDKVIGL